MKARRLTVAGGTGAVLVVVLLATASASSVRSDGADAAGPLDLAGVDFSQHNRAATLVIHTHLPPPSLTALTRYPNHVDSTDQRYLCMKVHGSKVKPKLPEGSNLRQFGFFALLGGDDFRLHFIRASFCASASG